MNYRISASTAALVATLAFGFCCFVAGQSSPPLTAAPAFSVASIKPREFMGQGRQGMSISGDRVTISFLDVLGLVRMAYDLQNYQVFGEKGWMGETTYEIVAKTEAGVIPSFAEAHLMLRALLVERFQLRFHRETRSAPIYVLTYEKANSALKESVGQGQLNISGPAGGSQRSLTMKRVPMAQLAVMLSNMTGRPVVDHTGLSGPYDFTLQWARTQDQAADSSTVEAEAAVGPSIFTAVREQLGLRLVPQTGPIEVLVIDHVERPSEN